MFTQTVSAIVVKINETVDHDERDIPHVQILQKRDDARQLSFIKTSALIRRYVVHYFLDDFERLFVAKVFKQNPYDFSLVSRIVRIYGKFHRYPF